MRPKVNSHQFEISPVFELDRQNRFAKNSECSKEKGLKDFLDLRIILWKMRKVLTKFRELIWTNMYYESLWNHIVLQQGVFNRLKITSCIASSMKIHEVFDFSHSQFSGKMQKLIANCQNALQIANCERLIRTLSLQVKISIQCKVNWSWLFTLPLASETQTGLNFVLIWETKVKFQTGVIFSSKHQKPEVKQCGTCLQQNTQVSM